jgi:Uma2 family endonuclease
MTISATKKYWTDEELLAMPKDGYEREIVNGELIVSPAGAEHGVIIGRIMSYLGSFICSSGLGEMLDGQTGFRMASDDVFSPDVSFITTERWAAHRKTGNVFVAGAPDLVVEVLSPGDTVGVTEEKIAQYFKNGSRLAWVVHPRTKTVFVYHGPAADKLLKVSDALDGEDVVPGFTLPLSQVFK